jgi:hypothetical protein
MSLNQSILFFISFSYLLLEGNKVIFLGAFTVIQGDEPHSVGFLDEQ